MSLPHLLSTIYRTLGFNGNERAGLFQTFDPSKYKGKLPIEDHFVNLFKKRLWGSILRAINPRSDAGRPCDRSMFAASADIGLIKQEKVSKRGRESIDCIQDALARLGPIERLIIELKYWLRLSNRTIAAELSIGRGTVRNKHSKAIRELRRYYDSRIWTSAERQNGKNFSGNPGFDRPFGTCRRDVPSYESGDAKA